MYLEVVAWKLSKFFRIQTETWSFASQTPEPFLNNFLQLFNHDTQYLHNFQHLSNPKHFISPPYKTG